MPCTCNVHPMSASHTAMRCQSDSVPVCRVWFRYFKNRQSQRILRKLSDTPLAFAPCAVEIHLPQWHAPTDDGKRLTKFEPCATKCLICSLERMNRGEITFTCPPRAVCIQRQLFIQCREASNKRHRNFLLAIIV